jgi:hypothetical protein
MREHDCGRPNPGHPVQPIATAIDHDAGAMVADKKRTVPPMQMRARIDLAARSEESQRKPPHKFLFSNFQVRPL